MMARQTEGEENVHVRVSWPSEFSRLGSASAQTAARATTDAGLRSQSTVNADKPCAVSNCDLHGARGSSIDLLAIPRPPPPSSRNTA
jgi:hypothetical protein